MKKKLWIFNDCYCDHTFLLFGYRPRDCIIMKENESEEESTNGDHRMLWSGKRAGLDNGKQVS